MYQFKDLSGGFFKMPHWIIDNGNWAALSLTAKAVLPVIARHCAEDGVAFPSERTVAILCDMQDKYVRKGIFDLNGFPGFSLKTYTTSHGRRGKKFHLDWLGQGESFPIRHALIDGGNWGLMKPTARAVYVAMRRWGFLPDATELGDDYATNYAGEYANRKFEYCEAEWDILCRAAGITVNKRSFNSAIDDLRKHHCIGESDYDSFKVYLTPPCYYKRAWMNGRVADRYAKEMG